MRADYPAHAPTCYCTAEALTSKLCRHGSSKFLPCLSYLRLQQSTIRSVGW